MILALRAALPEFRGAPTGPPPPGPQTAARGAREVVFYSHTMVATAAAIHFAGAIPVPVECGPDHLIDAGAVEAAVTPRTRAIVPTQLNVGGTADMDALQSHRHAAWTGDCRRCRESLGIALPRMRGGDLRRGCGHQLFPRQTAGVSGGRRGGDRERLGGLRTPARIARSMAGEADGEIVSWGLNSRLDEPAGRHPGPPWLGLYPQAIEYAARALARLYRYSALRGTWRNWSCRPGPDSDASPHFDVYQNYEIEAPPPRPPPGVPGRLRNRHAAVPWGGKAVHQWPVSGASCERLPFTEQLFTRLLLLPLNLSLSDDDVNQVYDAIHSFYRG